MKGSRSLGTSAFALCAPLVLALCACGSPLATTVSDSQKAAISVLAGSIDRVAVYAEIRDYFAVPREPIDHAANLALAHGHIVAQLSASGCEVETVPVTIGTLSYYAEDGTPFGRYEPKHGSFAMDNIIGRKAGTNPALAPVMLCAHYDTVNLSPGVGDNGTGCAGVLEAARRLSGATFERTVIFALFAFEESGLCGSQAYADSLSADELPDSAIVFETMGFTAAAECAIPGSDFLLGLPGTGDFLGFFGSFESRSLVMDFADAASACAPGLKTYGCSLDANLASNPLLASTMRSDHSSFWKRGVPALMVTDTADMRVGAPYHSARDTLENLDLDFLCDAIRAGLGTVCARAGLVSPP
jgi:aminopeptidase YwaD